MKLTRKISHQLEAIRKLGLCPSFLNLDVERYSFRFFVNDVISGIKIFLMLCPIALALTFFCGASPIQGIISCAVASICSIIIGGSRYQVSAIALPLCVVTFEILVKYQYKGLLFTAIFASSILIIFGVLRFSDVLKYLSSAYISAIIVFVSLSIIVSQAQAILDISTIQSSQSLLDNIDILKSNIGNITFNGFMYSLAFIAPLVLLRLKIKSHISFFIYLLIGAAVVFIYNLGLLPASIGIKTIGEEFLNSQAIDNITTISRSAPSQTFLINVLNYAFGIAIVIASEASFCTNVASSITGNKKLQGNVELISSGIANLASVASGGLFVSPDLSYTMKNISYKTKTVVGLLFIVVLSFVFIRYSKIILNYIPTNCISTILIVFAISMLRSKKILQYFHYKKSESYIFIGTLLAAMYFGFVPAVIIGFTASTIFFAKRMVRIKDASVHTTKNHDGDVIEFMSNKNGFSHANHISPEIMKKIEVIQIHNILFLNVGKLVEEALSARGSFPSVLVIYFRNVPFLDGEAIESLKDMVRNAKENGCMVIVSGTNGMLLEILRQKEQAENLGQIFGYIVPNFGEAIRKTVERLK